MTNMLMELKGTNGQLELYEDRIIIKREGLDAKLIYGLKGDKTIYLNQITGIELKEGGRITAGYIQFTLPGGIESRGGLFNAVKDENTVSFNKKDNELAQKIKLKIEELKTSLFQSISNPSMLNNPDIIRKYKQLCDDGIITQDEFEIKKKEILGF